LAREILKADSCPSQIGFGYPPVFIDPARLANADATGRSIPSRSRIAQRIALRKRVRPADTSAEDKAPRRTYLESFAEEAVLR
jgi:hypothetical protein